MSVQTNDMWYTPEYVLDAVRAFLPAYFDPCPQAAGFDGLEVTWGKYSFINPPYSRALRQAFVSKGNVEFNPSRRFLWLLNFGNNMDQYRLHSQASAVCIPFKRIQFIAGHHSLKAGSPRYDNIFILWGDPKGFREAFKDIGYVYINETSDGGSNGK